ncbi:MAG: hypothetical protein E7206_17825 [Clostridium beijerinckii]|nr:hypothetical protein [Clostridium beijerinckii]
MNYDKLLEELKKYEEPHEIGTGLMYHIVNNYPIEKRVEVIKSILNTFATDLLIHELPKGEVERIRKIITRI